ncbi:MAG TPA: nitroreductase family protein [Gaiellaceae bacterium]|nr:nitroreductase family protein [Gaiellaceae bacterium]
MEFREILARRRMHRAFESTPIPREQIERIVGVIRRAPSGGFTQGSSIVVVTDAATRRQFADAWADHPLTQTFVAQAPVHLVLSASESLYHARYNQPDKLAETGGVEVTWPVPYWFVDAGALMMLVLLAAIDEGLAGAFIGHPEQKRLFAEIVGLPDEVVPIGLALIGRPAPDPTADRGTSRLRELRRPTGDIVHWERW